MKHIIFVCTGNSCRSPMAEGFLKRIAQERSQLDITVSSAGISAMNGYPASAEAVQVMRELGIDISSHRSRTITTSVLEDASVVVAMASNHMEALVNLNPAMVGKMYLLTDFESEAQSGSGKGITDPIGMSVEGYRKVRDEIKELVTKLAERLQ